MARYREEVEAGRLRVLFVDESHLLSGDLQGYVWGRTDERIEVPIVNERDRQTYYGALDMISKRLVVEAHAKGDTTETIAYLKLLQIGLTHLETLMPLKIPPAIATPLIKGGRGDLNTIYSIQEVCCVSPDKLNFPISAC